MIRISVGGSVSFDHQEFLTVRGDVVIVSFEQRVWRARPKLTRCLDVDSDDGISVSVEELLPVRRQRDGQSPGA